jgi:octaheme c-type cytochrome (tetrathionate reductase family)
MNRLVPFVALLVLILILAVHLFHRTEIPNLHHSQLQQQYSVKPVASVDHSLFEELHRDFSSPQEVTETCISCHNLRHIEVMASNHWNWERVSYVEGRGIERVGKQNVLNNYCIGTSSNQQSCARCHIGFGMTNNLFDFENARNVDCMVCHDHSEEYVKGVSTAGYPDRTVNLEQVAQSVGRPGRLNCGACHFYGGGGNNVKHGDLEEALLSTDRSVDVHMAVNGMNMTCVDCHTAENHKMKGTLYSVSSTHVNRLSCDDCHTSTPHMDRMLNVHTARVACQTCHIPEYAKVNPTKMAWRWSEAGRLKEGAPYSEKDSMGREVYLSIKGAFEWGTNLQPEYLWFNGHAMHTILGDKVDTIPFQMNRLLGAANDSESKIIPVKVHRGDQIYDPVTGLLIQPKLWSDAKGDSAFWMDLDWHEAAMAGMNEVGLPYSGEYEFIATEMYWPINHMVAPKEMALSCVDCHTRENGRLAALTDFYLPGRDSNAGLSFFGRIAVWSAFLGVLLHGFLRFIVAVRNKEIESEEINTDL